MTRPRSFIPALASFLLAGCGNPPAAPDDGTDAGTSTTAESSGSSSTEVGSTTSSSTDGLDDTSTGDTDDGREYVPEDGVEFIEANGEQLGYFAEGDGPLVLLFHGFPDTPHTYDELRPALAAAGFRAVSPFSRGYAPSSIPATEAFDAQTLGEDVIALVDAFGEDQAYLVGHDWGAFSAYAAASLAPERFTAMVTIAIPHPGFFVPDPGFFERADHFIYLAQEGAEELMRADDFAHVDELYARWSPTWDFAPAETEPVKNAFSAPGSLNAALGYYRAATPMPPEFLQQPIAGPTLTIAGLDDGVMLPEGFEQTAAGFSAGWELLTLAGGHFVLRENPDEAIAAIVEFLQGA